MSMRLTFLCDNEAAPDLGSEWGLSVAVEMEDGSLWLWDTGQSDLFLRNAETLGVDLRRATGLALSHGHYDHTGGLRALLAAGFKGRILAHPEAGKPRYNHGKSVRDIGPPAPLPDFEAVADTSELSPGLRMFTNIPRRPDLFQAVRGFSYDPEGKLPDPVPDDAFLLLETRLGPVLLLGCCHSGLENSLLHLRNKLGLNSLHAVVGGLHLYNADPTQWERVALALEDFGVQRLAVGHCTGSKAADYLKERLDCEVLRTHARLRIEFD
jgi:7,8-dihydropterin-6-yl-methyl-4-(beta-D-ribofuranosyl)aminobenzene 5'-phosphate synthase